MRRRASPVTGMKIIQLRMLKLVPRASVHVSRPFRLFFIPVTGLKFPIWTDDKIRPGNRVEALSAAAHTTRWAVNPDVQGC